MNTDRFGHLPRTERALLFEALLHCIDTNSGIGYPRSDQDHPDYHDGQAGRPPIPGADSADKSMMFDMVRELSLHLADDDAVTGWKKHLIFTWEQFCRRGIKAAESTRSSYVRLIERDP